ncbi:ARL4 [Lepeophtheirus salmonis]|uniref:ARL4 n=1 Tax=Lepeophtheirus salmonis TaxID=72036 RepID=A0A7R8H696_LEPSM|nr:ARL4 [Lepeophtheirus salmonis]CAF2892569.1 ARL4 [Lepeophtheirus salmonis]
MGGHLGKEPLSNLVNLGTYHCAMIGLDSSGKTTVLYRLKFDQYMNTAPTIGFNCEKVRTGGVNFLVWDVGGQDKLRPLWRSYTRCTDGIIFVIDSCQVDRLEEAKLELLKISCSTSKLESSLGLKDLGVNTPWHIQSTCAVTGEGLEEGMDKLHRMIAVKRKKNIKVSRKVQRSHSYHH